jgi:hypothetical protein
MDIPIVPLNGQKINVFGTIYGVKAKGLWRVYWSLNATNIPWLVGVTIDLEMNAFLNWQHSHDILSCHLTYLRELAWNTHDLSSTTS